MADTFDPYHRWLSIPPEEQPPNHYRLLGLKVLEDDADVIESAADRQMTHVRTFQSGKFAEHSQRILNEISAAKVTLLDPAKKAAYDAPLRAKLSDEKRVKRPERPLAVAQPLAPTATLASQPPNPQPPTVAPPTAENSPDPFAHAPTGVSAPRVRRQKSTSPTVVLALAGVVLVTLAVLGAVAAIVGPWESSTEVTENDPPVVSPPITTPDDGQAPPSVEPPRVKPPQPPDDPPDDEPENELPPEDDPEDLTPDDELDDPPPDEPEEAPRVPQRSPVPPKAERDAQREKVDAIFQSTKAKSPAEKADLAAQLFRTAAETPDDPVAVFVMLNLARELAGDAARMQLAFDAIDLLEQQFNFDADAVRVLTIAQGAKAAVPNDAKQEVVTLGVELANQMAAADKYEDAAKILNGLVDLARRAREPQVAAVLIEHRRVNEVLFTAYKSAQGAIQTLKTSPDDPAANLAVGRFHLIVKKDAARGLMHLAKGSDEALAAAAKLELTNPQKPDEQEQLADAWWNLAANEEAKETKQQFQARSMAWYQRVQPELKGLAAAKADKRLHELADAGVQPAEINLDLGVFDDEPSAARELPANLLDLVDVNLHSLKHIWDRRGKEVAASEEGAALLRIPVDIDGSYVFRTELTRETGNETIGISLPVADHRCLFVLSAYTGGAGGLMLIDGRELRDTNNPTRVAPNSLTNGQRYTVEITVMVKGDQAAITATLDGRTFCRWQGAASSLSVFGDHDVPAPNQIGLYSRISRTVFHSASLTLRDGTATPAADAVLPGAIAKPRRLPTNLLELVDVDAHALKQKWTRDGEDIVAPQAYAPLLKIPVTVTGNYELSVEFTRQTGGDIVGLVLPVGDLYCPVLLSTNGGEAGYVGEGGDERVTIKPSYLTNGKRHVLTARVTSKGEASTVDVTLDGVAFDRWTGAGVANDTGDRRMSEPRHIALYAHESQTAFHTAQLKLLAGTAKPDADARKLPRAAVGATAPSSDVTSDLVAHWKFDEGSGAVATDAVAGLKGEIRGATWVSGARGKALRFDGKDDSVLLGNPDALNFDGPMTIAAWVRTLALPPQTTQGDGFIANVISHGYAYDARREVRLSLEHAQTGPRWVGIAWHGDTSTAAVGKFIPQDLGLWAHVAMTCDGAAWRFYRNGRLIGEKETTQLAVAVPADWAIAAHSGGSFRNFNGDIDDLRIYRRGLAEQDVRTLYLGRSATIDNSPAPEPRVPVRPINLLTKIIPKTDSIVGPWEIQNGSLRAPIAPHARVRVPVDPGEEYDLRLVVEPTRPERSLVLGLVGPGKQKFAATFQSWDGGKFTGLEFLDDKPSFQNETAYDKPVFNDGRNAIVCSVRKSGVRVTVNDKPVVDWQGDFARLGIDRNWDIADNPGLFVGAYNSGFWVHTLTLTPYQPARLPSSTGARGDVTRGLVAHWKFDDGRGEVATDAAGESDGEVRGATWVKGIRGGALRFDGKDDLVFIGQPKALNLAGEITVSVRVRPLSETPTRGEYPGVASVIARGFVTNPTREFSVRQLRPVNGGPAYWNLEANNGSGHVGVDGPAMELEKWVHIVVVYDGSAWNYYSNGKLHATQDSSISTPMFDGGWAIGGHASDPRQFHGEIDDVRIYNRGLSADEVKSLATTSGAAPSNDEGASRPRPPARETLPAAPLSSPVIITRAVYGAGGQVVDVTEKVRAALKADPFAPVQADDRMMGDPAPGTPKELVITYAVAGKPQTVRLNQPTPAHLPQLPAGGIATKDASEEFRILAARYGAGLTWIDITEAVRGTVSRTDVAYQWSFQDSDPWFGVPKRSSIWFDYKGKRYHRFFTDGEKQALLH